MFDVVISKHKFSSNDSVIKEYRDLIAKSLEGLEANFSTQDKKTKDKLQSKSPDDRAPLNLKKKIISECNNNNNSLLANPLGGSSLLNLLYITNIK